MPPKAPPNPLDSPLTGLRGIGPERAAQLARLGLRTIGDLLLHRPRRYEDRRHFRAIAELQPGEAATARGSIVALGVKWWRARTRSVFEFILDDGTARLHCRWWNLPFMENYFHQGDEIFVHGKLSSLKPRAMDHPETEVVESGEENFIHLNRIVPVYPLTEGLPQRWLRSLLWRTLEQFESRIAERWPPTSFPDLPARADAIRRLHFPEEISDAEVARQRLALDEFLELQIEIQRRRRKLQTEARGLACAGDNRWMKPFLARLGFKLTGAQTRVLREIRKDMAGERQPMRRLLQGDVGAGKTAVAACTALMSLESGCNVALMAPTEILAEQHFQTFTRWFAPLGINVRLHTGTRNKEDGSRIPDHPSRIPHPASPSTLFIGTHALITSGFDLPDLGLVIIDEQHKFGVAQREKLVRKGRYPHLLVMTATPIPRTLALTIYGDLDVSVIDELPGGRGRIKTFVRAADRLAKVWDFVREKLKEGRQAYVVYPRVEQSDHGDLKAVTKEWESLRRELAPFQVGLLHGRVRASEKEQAMEAFRANRIQVLVATSVIEVGVDVPNATVMVIGNAERFGLAQLHQLRGRIGRGAHQSQCILVADIRTEEAKARLEVLAETTDGFRIADEDLRLRGAGDLLGQEQSGLPPFRFGDLARDRELVERARRLAATEGAQR